MLSLCCLVARGKDYNAALWCKGRTPRAGKGRGLKPGQDRKGMKVGKPPLLLSQRPSSNHSSVSSKTPKSGSLIIKMELFPPEKQNCLNTAAQSSLG